MLLLLIMAMPLLTPIPLPIPNCQNVHTIAESVDGADVKCFFNHTNATANANANSQLLKLLK